MDAFGFLALVLMFALILSVYLLPTLVAAFRDHEATFGIFLLNFLLGWTTIAWIFAIAWAFSSPSGSSSEEDEPPARDTAEKLESLLRLRDTGDLTEQEFRCEKQKVLAGLD